MIPELSESIEVMINPNNWAAAGGDSALQTVDSKLIINAPRKTHEGIEQFLSEISKQSKTNLKPTIVVEKPLAKSSEADPSANKTADKPK
jgi:hypothetical protein